MVIKYTITLAVLMLFKQILNGYQIYWQWQSLFSNLRPLWGI